MKRQAILFLVPCFLLAGCRGENTEIPDGTRPIAGSVAGGMQKAGGWEILEVETSSRDHIAGMLLPAPPDATMRAIYQAVLFTTSGRQFPFPGNGRIQDARFAPNGSIAYLDDRNVLFLWELPHTEPAKLAENVFPGFSFSPDGQRIAYSSGIFPEMDLYVIHLDDPTPKRLTFEDGPTWGPAFSPDGRELVFVSSEGGYPSLAILPLMGGDARRVTNRDLPKEGLPVHSSLLAPFPNERRPPVWTAEGIYIEGTAGVHLLDFSGRVKGHWPQDRKVFLTPAGVSVVRGMDLVILPQEARP